MSREIMQQALGAFEAIMFETDAESCQIIAKNARYALREELAKPQPEWVGLTDDEIKKIMQRWRNGYIDIKDVEQLLKDKNT